MTSTATESPRRSRRLSAVVGAGALGSIALALSMSGTLSAFTASITNSVNTAGVGSLVMVESGPNSSGTTVTCETTPTQTSTTCGTINKYGGVTTMGTSGATSSTTTNISINNSGTAAASSFTLTPGACTLTNTNSTSGDLCALAKVTIVQDGVAIATDIAPSALATYTLTPVAAGATSNIAITFSTAGLDDTVQGQQVSQPLTWTFNA